MTLADAMILIGATALGLALVRSYVIASRQAGLMWATQVGSILLVCWTLAFLVVRLRHPRPSLRRIARQPGMAACSAAVAWWAVDGSFIVADLITIHPPLRPPVVWLGQLPAGMAAPAILGAWLALAFAGVLRAEPSWVDRLGRGIGLGWLGFYLANWVYVFLHP